MFYDGLTWLFDVSLLVLLLTPELLPLAACFDLLGLLSLGTGIFHVDDSFKKLNHTSLNIHVLLSHFFTIYIQLPFHTTTISPTCTRNCLCSMTVGYFYWVAAPTTLAICCNFLTGIMDVSLLVLHSVNPGITSQSTGLREKIRWVAGYVLCKKNLLGKLCLVCFKLLLLLFLFCCTQWKQLSTTRVRWRYTTALMFHRTRELLHALL